MAAKSHKKRIIILALISTSLIAILGFGFYTFFNAKDEPVTTTTVVAKKETPTETVAGIIGSQDNLKDFTKSSKEVALFSSLDGQTPYTVFSFNNEAFKQAPQEVEEIFKNDNKADSKKDIINYHIVSGNVEPSAMNEGQKLKTMNGSEIVVKKENQNIYLVDMKGNSVKVEKAGIPAKNGSVYIISGILLPQ